MPEIKNILDNFSTTSLEEMGEVKLMNRTDTKFIFNVEKLPAILNKATELYKVLEISNTRILDYRTLYFDTPEFEMYNLHQNGKLNRYKVRHREYLISNISFLEVKFKSNKERTIKKRIKQKEIKEEFSDKSKAFILKNSPYKPNELVPKLYNKFSRITLVHKYDKERITIDLNLAYKTKENNIDLPFLVIVEVKQEGFSNLSDFIKILRSQKIQATGMSKYCVGTVLMNKNIKYNRFKTKLLTLTKLSNDAQFIRNYC